MAKVTITVNGITVECELEDVAAVTAQLGGAGGVGQDDGGASRPGERRRENPTDATTQARAEEFRRIRSKYTNRSVEQVAGAKLPRDPRRRTAEAGS